MKWIKASESMSPPIGKVLVRFTDTGQKHLLNITSLIDFKVEVDIRGYCFKKDEVEWLDESTPDGWVSVEERLPEGYWSDTEQEFYKKFSEQVNVYVDNGTVGTAAYNRETKKWFIGDVSEQHYQELERTKVTHWQPLPQPPKQ